METQFEFFEVGGCVRDFFLGVKSKDVDFVATSNTATDTPFQDMVTFLKSEGFKVWEERPEFLTVRAGVPDGHALRKRTKDADFVLARKDVDCSGGRKATSVMASDLMNDLARRDFTVNAMARNATTGELVDPFGGQQDLSDKVLRFVGNPTDRILEDGLRVLRGFRFWLTKGLMPEPASLEALMSDVAVASLGSVSSERTRDELERMFKFDTLGTLRLLEMMPRELKEVLFSNGLRLSATMKG